MRDWPLLEALGDEDRRRVLAAARRRRYARREVLWHEGDPGDTLHLIDSGRIAIRVGTPLGDTATVTVLGPGDVVGELALLDGGQGRRTASAVALEKSETLVLHHDAFEELRRAHPTVERFLSAVLAAQVRRLTSHLLDALYVPADVRVARRLLELDAVYDGGDIALTQEDVATLAGTSRATVNRVVGELEEAGAVEVRRGCIKVVDGDRLARKAR
ncbi:MAG TPA: Crp/Fnr family transcriptional regulator [Acidimicrobiales bacterium]|jgi:CRP-like cAMP-binding protein|nr:Crp/Fnr family transcriptional regulator [Acidimicrobiales bacterium]